MKRKICVVTGSRSEYGIFYPVLRAIQRSPLLRLQLIATGMHLMREFGYSLDLIRKDGFRVTTVDMSHGRDTGEAMAEGFAKAVSGLAKAFHKLKPDVVLILGDRGEALAAAIAANYLNIPVAHIHGGEVSGHIDGNIRHAITKLSQLHFPATKRSAERLARLGEERWRIHAAGAPALDRILSGGVTPKRELLKRYGLDGRPLAIVIQHPVHTQIRQAAAQIQTTLDSLAGLPIQAIGVYPNADAGGRAMITRIRRLARRSRIRFHKNLPHADYLGLLKMAGVLIGNSSSAIIEAPSFHLPAVNLGDRQQGRERAGNVIDVPFSTGRIRRAVRKALSDRRWLARVRKTKNPYGDGTAGEKIADRLGRIRLDRRLLEKALTY